SGATILRLRSPGLRRVLASLYLWALRRLSSGIIRTPRRGKLQMLSRVLTIPAHSLVCLSLTLHGWLTTLTRLASSSIRLATLLLISRLRRRLRSISSASLSRFRSSWRETLEEAPDTLRLFVLILVLLLLTPAFSGL